MTRRGFGFTLLLLGVLLAIAGGIVWKHESDRVAKANANTDVANVLIGAIGAEDPIHREQPARGPAEALLLAGGAAALAGLVLFGLSFVGSSLAAGSDGEDDETAGPRSGSGTKAPDPATSPEWAVEDLNF